MLVDGGADTGAQVHLWGGEDFYKFEYKEKDLIIVKRELDGQPVEATGAVCRAAEVNPSEITLVALVTPET